MNILFFSMDFKPKGGGVAEYVHQLARGLNGRGDHVVVVGPEMEGAEEFDAGCGYPVVRISQGDPKRRWPWQRMARQMARMKAFEQAVEQHKVEQVFFGVWGLLSWNACLWTKGLGLPYSVLVHGRELTGDYTDLPRPKKAKEGLSGAQLVFANSNFMAGVVKGLGVPEERIRLAYPGVDPDEFTPGEVGQEERKRLGVAGRKVVLTVCRLVEGKGIQRSMEAIMKVAEKHPEVVYLIVGDGPDRERLEGIARELKVGERVRFLGYLRGRELLTMYQMCDCFLMPARVLPGGEVETFGIVFLEAGACGKAVVAGRAGGMREAVLDGQTGLLVEPEDTEAIAEAVERLLGDKELARRLGEQGRRRVEESLSWRVRVSQVRAEIEGVGKKK